MLRFAGDRGFAKRINWLLRYRPFGYILFVLAILLKLKILHSQLHALYIDMNLLDDLIAIGSVMLVSFWTLWLPPRGRSLALAVLNVLLTALIFPISYITAISGISLRCPCCCRPVRSGSLAAASGR